MISAMGADSDTAGNGSDEVFAAVLVELLNAPASAGTTVELISGDTPIADAVSALGR